MQVWSNEQSTQEYRDLLNGVVLEKKNDGPAVIVGGNGKLGSFLRVSYCSKRAGIAASSPFALWPQRYGLGFRCGSHQEDKESRWHLLLAPIASMSR